MPLACFGGAPERVKTRHLLVGGGASSPLSRWAVALAERAALTLEMLPPASAMSVRNAAMCWGLADMQLTPMSVAQDVQRLHMPR